jgi:hypothetical protein
MNALKGSTAAINSMAAANKLLLKLQHYEAEK